MWHHGSTWIPRHTVASATIVPRVRRRCARGLSAGLRTVRSPHEPRIGREGEELDEVVAEHELVEQGRRLWPRRVGTPGAQPIQLLLPKAGVALGGQRLAVVERDGVD